MKLLPPAGPERRRQLGRLGVLVAALAVAVWYQWPPAAPSAPASNLQTAPPVAAEPLSLPEPVKLGALDEVPAETDVGRNPFGFGARPAPVPSPASYRPPTVSVPAGPAAPAGPPPIALRLTGLLVHPASGRRMATLKDPASGALFHAYEGDVVDGRYRVVKVGLQSVVVSYVDDSGHRTLGLGSQAP
jgi:hypothetical protein